MRFSSPLFVPAKAGIARTGHSHYRAGGKDRRKGLSSAACHDSTPRQSVPFTAVIPNGRVAISHQRGRILKYLAGIVVWTWLAATGAAQSPPGSAAEQSDEDIWQQLQSLSGTHVEESLWDAAETATERVFGQALDQENGETVFQTIEAAADGDWRNAFETAGPSLLSAYLPGVSQYVEAIQTAAAQIDRSTDQWAEQLYDHESYYWVGAQVDARVAAMNGPMLDDYGDPFYGRINDNDEAFMPSYALPDGSAAKQRAREFEAALFARFIQQPFYDELIATDYTANGGGVSGLYENSYAAMIREDLGYQPEPRRLFNHFYHRYTRDRLARYQEVHEYVQAELMRREARRQRAAVIQAYREALEAEAPSVDQMLAALRANDVNAVRRGLAAGFDPNVWPEDRNVPFMYMAGVALAQDPSIQPVFDLLVEAGGEVRPDVPDDTPEVFPAAIRSAGEAGALAVIDAGFRTQVSYAEGDTMLRRAVMAEMPRVIARLTTIGHDPDIRDDEGHPLIMEAVYTGNRAVLDAVIDGGANVNARSTSNNGNAILLAGMHDHAALVPTLINAGAQIDGLLSEAQPYSALMIAAMQGHFETVRALVEAGADLTIEASGRTAADYARRNGHDEIADYLFRLMPEEPVRLGMHRLLPTVSLGENARGVIVIHEGHASVESLTITSSDPARLTILDEPDLSEGTIRPEGLVTEFEYVAQQPGTVTLTVQTTTFAGTIVTRESTVELLDPRNELRRDLVRYGHDMSWVRNILNEHPSALIADVFSMCERNADPDCDASQRVGGGVLYDAVLQQNATMVELLLERGADTQFVLLRGPVGDTTALGLAVAHREPRLETVQALLRHGADPNYAPGDAQPPLLLALRRQRFDFAIALLNAGADPNIMYDPEEGLTVLHIAAGVNNLPLINALLSAGARIRNDNEGNPPGHVSYWAHDDLQLALRLGYDEAREYEARERRRNRPGFDWNEFARRMQPVLEEGAAEIAAIQSEHNRRVQEIERDYDDGMRRARQQARSQSQPYTPSSTGSNAPDFSSIERESGTGRQRPPSEPSRELRASADTEAELPPCEVSLTRVWVYMSDPELRRGAHGFPSACRTGDRGESTSVEWTRPVSVCGRVLYMDEGQAPGHRGASPVPIGRAVPSIDGSRIREVQIREEGQGEFRTCN